MRSARVLVLSAVLVLSVGCGRQERAPASPLSPSETRRISTATAANDIFEKPTEIELETGAESAVALITDMDIGVNGDFIIADGWRLHCVYVFSREGRFLRILGRQGQGPGEYSTPVSVAVNSRGEILISDYMRNQIIVYAEDGRYLRFLQGKPHIPYFLHLNSKNEIYAYSGTVGPGARTTFNAVHKLDGQGGEILSFAPVPEDVLKLRFSAVDDGMTIGEDDMIYEMNPLFYQIRKYAPDGKLVGTFSSPHSHIAAKPDGTPEIFNGPHYLEGGLLVIQRGKDIDVFDTAGNFLVGGIPFPSKIVAAKRNILYCEEWNETTTQQAQANSRVLCYALRHFAR
jgi:hypothetical protein